MKKTLSPRFAAALPPAAAPRRPWLPFGGLGLLVLLGGLGLMASRPAHSVGGPVAVSVANTPLAVTEPVNPPFIANITISIPDGSSGGSFNGDFSGAQSFVVPAGKRFVVQTVSLYRGLTVTGTTGSSVQVFVDGYINGQFCAFSVPPAAATGSPYPGSTASETFSLDPGRSFLVNAFRTGTTGSENDYVTVSGYLVNAS